MADSPPPPVAAIDVPCPPPAPLPHVDSPGPGANVKKYCTWKEAWDDARVVVAIDIAVLATTVSEPLVAGGYMSKHVTYLVRTEPYTYLVRRRYSDFVWLRETLQRRFIGMLLPSLPPKAYGSSGTSNAEKSSVVKHRMRMLGYFLQNLVEIPYVRGDASVLAFLSVQNEGEFESARTATSVPDLFTDTSAGAVKWRDALRSAEIPHNGQRVLMDFIGQLEYLEAHLKKLTVSAKAIAEKAIAKKTEMENLTNLIGDWHKSEEEFGNGTKFEYPNKTAAGMAKALSATEATFKKWAQILSFEPTIVESVVYAALAYLLQQVDAFKNMIKLRDATIRDLQKSERSLNSKKEEREKNGGDGSKPSGGSVFSFGSGGESLADAIDREEQEVRGKRRSVEAMARSLFFSEIDRFNEDRRTTIESAMGCLAASETMVAKKSGKVFTQFFSSTGLDCNEWSQKAKDVLALQESVADLNIDAE